MKPLRILNESQWRQRYRGICREYWWKAYKVRNPFVLLD